MTPAGGYLSPEARAANGIAPDDIVITHPDQLLDPDLLAALGITPAELARLAMGVASVCADIQTTHAPEVPEALEAADRLPRDHRARVLLRACVTRSQVRASMVRHPGTTNAEAARWTRDTTDAATAARRYGETIPEELAALATRAHREHLALQAAARCEHPSLVAGRHRLAALQAGTGHRDAPPPPRETEPHGAALIATAHAAQAPPVGSLGVRSSAPGGLT